MSAIKIIDENGSEKQVENLLYFTDTEKNSDFLLYSEPENDNEMTTVHAFNLLDNKLNTLTDDQWSEVKDVMRKVIKKDIDGLEIVIKSPEIFKEPIQRNEGATQKLVKITAEMNHKLEETRNELQVEAPKEEKSESIADPLANTDIKEESSSVETPITDEVKQEEMPDQTSVAEEPQQEEAPEQTSITEEVQPEQSVMEKNFSETNNMDFEPTQEASADMNFDFPGADINSGLNSDVKFDNSNYNETVDILSLTEKINNQYESLVAENAKLKSENNLLKAHNDRLSTSQTDEYQELKNNYEEVSKALVNSNIELSKAKEEIENSNKQASNDAYEKGFAEGIEQGKKDYYEQGKIDGARETREKIKRELDSINNSYANNNIVESNQKVA